MFPHVSLDFSLITDDQTSSLVDPQQYCILVLNIRAPHFKSHVNCFSGVELFDVYIWKFTLEFLFALKFKSQKLHHIQILKTS